MNKLPTKQKAIAELAERFQRNGYIRRQNTEHLKQVGYMLYKKGFEIRLIAHSVNELHHIQFLLQVLDFTISKPFSVANHFRQPIYGREQVTRFLSLIGYPDL